VGEAAGEGIVLRRLFLLSVAMYLSLASPRRIMKPQALLSDVEYERALQEISACFECQPLSGTPDAARFDALAALIEAYEETHYPMDIADKAAG
jgi:hypothetical protein